MEIGDCVECEQVRQRVEEAEENILQTDHNNDEEDDLKIVQIAKAASGNKGN